MKLSWLWVLVLSAFIVSACGDDESSFAPRDDESSSSIEAESSSSSVTLSGASAESNGSSSSSAKSSSSTDSKSSSFETLRISGRTYSLTSLDEDSIACDHEGTYSEIVYEKALYSVVCQNGFFVNALQSSSSEDSFVECDAEGQISYMLVDHVRTRFICENGRLVEFPESSSSVKSSSSYFNMSKQYNDKEWIKYERFVDPRDNQEYRTITVEKEVYNRTLVILAGNLNYGNMVTAKTATYSDEIVENFCYNDDPWYCENGFGGMYTWSEAMGLPRACDTVALGSTPECPEATGFGEDGRRQGICPEGWHVMNEREWRMMPTSEGFGAKPMLSQVFDGRDYIGLAVLLGGMSNPDLIEKNYYRIGTDGFYWVAEEIDSLRVGVVSFTETNVNFSASMNKPSVLSVRCVKDY